MFELEENVMNWNNQARTKLKQKENTHENTNI